jgi:hypothetical protein
MDEYSWSVPPEPPYIFSLSTTPSEAPNGPPQKQPGLHVASPTFPSENLPNDTQNPYMPCDAISPPSTTNPASHVFNLSRLSSANASVLPPVGKALPTPPFTFGDIQSSFQFNVNEFWPLLGYDDHSSISDLSSIPDPSAAPGDEHSPSLDNRAANPILETCSPPPESASTPGNRKNSKAATVPRKSRSSRRSPSTRPSKKSKPAEDESDDGSVRV